jgi:iron complex transport system substrate-binding protein
MSVRVMSHNLLRPIFATACRVSAALLLLVNVAAAREIIDSANRKVDVPDRVERVMAAGPPASVLVYVLAPQKLIGWNRKPHDADLPYLSPIVRNLPEVGRLTGRGDTANLETVMSAKPDVIVDFGSVNATYASLADRVQSQTGIPYLLIDGRFENTVAALRMLGSVLGVSDRAEQLARRTQNVFDDIDRIVRSVPEPQRPHVYLARRANGLETGNRGSINTEIIERAGGVNVVDAGRERGGLVTVSLEQVLIWNPDTIITTEPNFLDEAKSAPGWSNVNAVQHGHVLLSPRLPYGWIDDPPSLNRVLGLLWLSHVFYPDKARGDLRAEARDFYKLFYQVDLGEPELDRLLSGAQTGAK